MKLTNHAKNKLEIYDIPEDEIILACNNPVNEFYDDKEKTYILIAKWKKIIFAVVCDFEKERIITIYRTDKNTIQNRQKNNRWV